MRTKKVEGIINDIVLSIRYARLKEEVSDTQLKKNELSDKKRKISATEKKIEKHNDFINKVNVQLKEIENKNKPKKYNADINQKLFLLSRRSDYKFIKYQIGLQIILDNTFEYTDNTHIDFVENISTVLFDNNKIIFQIYEDYKNIKKQIQNTSSNLMESTLHATNQLISKLPMKDVVKVSAIIPLKPVFLVGGITLGGLTISQYFRKKRQLKKMTILGAGTLAEKLTINGVNLLYAQKYYEKEIEVQNYRKYLFKEINLERSIITKEIFEQNYDINENVPKLQVLHNFDNYIIGQMMLKKKNRGKKDV